MAEIHRHRLLQPLESRIPVAHPGVLSETGQGEALFMTAKLRGNVAEDAFHLETKRPRVFMDVVAVEREDVALDRINPPESRRQARRNSQNHDF